MEKVKLHGIYPPIATPFDHRGEIYPAKVRHNVEKWNKVALAGYVVCGAAGEGASLTTEEKIRMWGLAGDAACSERTLIAATGRESVRETVALTNAAASLGYHAALVETPHYYQELRDDVEAQCLYFGAAADQARIPLVIENRPETGIDLAAEAVARLSEHPNIVAVVENSTSLEKVTRMQREVKAGFAVLVGSAEVVWPALVVGAAGAVAAYANAAPYSVVTIWEAHRTRETEAAQDWQNRIGNAARLVTSRYGIAGMKHAMDLNGYYGGPCRLPLRPLGVEGKREIEEAFADLQG